MAFLPVKFVLPLKKYWRRSRRWRKNSYTEMVDHGFGYDEVSDLIRIEGDGGS